MRLTLLILLTLVPLSALCGEPSERASAPKEFSSLPEIRAWVDAHKVFGHPQAVDADLMGLHVFVAWNCPFSGRAAHYTYAYRLSSATGKWHLLDASFFWGPENLSFAYVDGRLENLVYIGTEGSVLKTVPLKGLRFK